MTDMAFCCAPCARIRDFRMSDGSSHCCLNRATDSCRLFFAKWWSDSLNQGCDSACLQDKRLVWSCFSSFDIRSCGQVRMKMVALDK